MHVSVTMVMFGFMGFLTVALTPRYLCIIVTISLFMGSGSNGRQVHVSCLGCFRPALGGGMGLAVGAACFIILILALALLWGHVGFGTGIAQDEREGEILQ
jgi:hypothetical protein